jgi:hypothetical protein
MRGNGEPDGGKLLHHVIVDGCFGMVQITSKPSIYRVSRGLPRLDPAFQHLDVRKTLLLIFRCLTDSTRFGGSRSIEDDFLGLW